MRLHMCFRAIQTKLIGVAAIANECPLKTRQPKLKQVVRHEHTANFPTDWNKASVELIRVDGPPNQEGKCNSTEDGPFTVSSVLRF